MGSLTTLLMAAGIVARPDISPSEDACPTSFREFFSRFTEDPAFQRQCTSAALSEAVAEGPLMPSRADQMAQGLGVTIRRLAHGQALVRLESVNGRGPAVEYVFEEAPNWTLVRRVESSAT